MLNELSVTRLAIRWEALLFEKEVSSPAILSEVAFNCCFCFPQAGLSMALGAFLAGLLLAETEFSLQVESDIAPYRGLLLGLFFMTVGTSNPAL